MVEKAVSEAARLLRKRAAGKGGKSRFAKLSKEERREVARHAAEGRWGKKAPEADKDTEETS